MRILSTLFAIAILALASFPALADKPDVKHKQDIIKDFGSSKIKWRVAIQGAGKMYETKEDLNLLMKNGLDVDLEADEPAHCNFILYSSSFNNPADYEAESLQIRCRFHGVDFGGEDATCSRIKGKWDGFKMQYFALRNVAKDLEKKLMTACQSK